MKTIQKKLPNGLRVVMIPQSEAQTVTALVLVGTGSLYEKKEENGLSHFLEHMYFKGTTNRPNAKIIAEAFDKLGAISNAFTEKEYTGYYAKGNPAHTEEFIDILSDIYRNALLPEADIEKEIGVVLEEISMYEDIPSYKVSEQLYAMMYGDQPAGWSVIGPKETVQTFTRKDLLRYEKTHYTPANTLVIVAGKIEPEQTYKKIKTSFGAIPMIAAKSRKKVVSKQHAPQTAMLHKKTDQANIAIGFRALPINHPDRAVVSLLSMILGGGMSSRLFLLLREEMGAVYDVHIEHDVYVDHGVFAIVAGIDKKRFDEIVGSIINELKTIKEVLVSEEELAKVKEQAIGMLRLGLESSDSMAGFFGTQLLLKGEYHTPEQMAKEYKKVTAADIRRIARKLFVASQANLSIVGPFEGIVVNGDIFTAL